jgi:hypothetical protein
MKPTPTPDAIAIDQITFYQSFIVGPGCWSCVLPVQLGIGPDSVTLWAAALDLRIEPEVMAQILNYPEPASFFYSHRIFVRLDVVTEVCPDGALARRAAEIADNALGLFDPTNFQN